jgi:hypothetical protein
MKKNVKSGLVEVAFEQLNIAFNPSTEHSQEQVEVSTDTSEQVKLEHSIDEKEICRYYIHEYKITQSDNCCYAVLHYLSNYDLPDEALHDLIVWRSHDYANILIDLADGLFNVFGSSFEHIKTTTWKITVFQGTLDEAFSYHTIEIVD